MAVGVKPARDPHPSRARDNAPIRPTAAGYVPHPLDLPEAVQPVRIHWNYAIPLTVVHLVALLAFVPWLFSWSGVVAAVVTHYVFGVLGITIGYHRLLTHRGFSCPLWLEHTLAVLGIFTLQDSPARWVAIHRLHHKDTDVQADPHTPLAGFFWGHMGWLYVSSRDHRDIFHYERYARDLLRDPFYFRLERNLNWFIVYIAHAVGFAALGFLIGWWSSGTLTEASRMALSMLVWGVFVRTVFGLHHTWAVNSASHIWGYRNYETDDNSRNNWFVSLLAHGEGWHNNHHADQRAAAHGHRWWEFDMSWWVIRGLEAVGLATDVVRPRSWKS